MNSIIGRKLRITWICLYNKNIKQFHRCYNNLKPNFRVGLLYYNVSYLLVNIERDTQEHFYLSIYDVFFDLLLKELITKGEQILL